jgi:hypothetical protein
MRRYMTPRLFREVRDGDEVIGWTYVAEGNYTTVRFGYISATAEHPHATEVYRSYAENHVRLLMGRKGEGGSGQHFREEDAPGAVRLASG